jgi:hypothetical protein
VGGCIPGSRNGSEETQEAWHIWGALSGSGWLRLSRQKVRGQRGIGQLHPHEPRKTKKDLGAGLHPFPGLQPHPCPSWAVQLTRPTAQGVCGPFTTASRQLPGPAATACQPSWGELEGRPVPAFVSGGDISYGMQAGYDGGLQGSVSSGEKFQSPINQGEGDCCTEPGKTGTDFPRGLPGQGHSRSGSTMGKPRTPRALEGLAVGL